MGNNRVYSHRGGVVELSPKHFKNKERNRWFDFFQMYTTNYIQEGDEDTERFRK